MKHRFKWHKIIFPLSHISFTFSFCCVFVWILFILSLTAFLCAHLPQMERGPFSHLLCCDSILRACAISTYLMSLVTFTYFRNTQKSIHQFSHILKAVIKLWEQRQIKTITFCMTFQKQRYKSLRKKSGTQRNETTLFYQVICVYRAFRLTAAVREPLWTMISVVINTFLKCN